MFLWTQVNSWLVAKLHPEWQKRLPIKGSKGQCQGFNKSPYWAQFLFKDSTVSGQKHHVESGAWSKVRRSSPRNPRPWQSLRPWQAGIARDSALWFSPWALEQRLQRVLPVGTDLIYIHLHYTVLLANCIQNIVQIPKFEKPEVEASMTSDDSGLGGYSYSHCDSEINPLVLRKEASQKGSHHNSASCWTRKLGGCMELPETRTLRLQT